MSVDIRKSDIEIFNNNGISTDDIRNTINIYRKRGVSDEEIQQKFQAKLQEFNIPKTTEKKEEVYTGPSRITGGIREAISGATLGAAPYIAGATNIIANPLGKATGAILGEGKFQASDLNPIKSFKEGKQEYQQEQEQFKEAYPTLATTANIAGSIPTYLVGGGELSSAVKGTKALAQAPKLVKRVVASTAGMQPLAVQKGIEESLKEDATVGSIAKQFGIGELEALSFGFTFGMLNPFESKIIAKASETTGIKQPFLRWSAINARRLPFIATEGVAIGSIPALTQGRLPTKEEIGSGVAATGVLRSVGAVAGEALPAARKFFTEPTAKQKAEIKAKYEQGQKIKQLDTEIADTEGRIQEIRQTEKPTEELKAEKKNLEYQKRWLLAEKDAVAKGTQPEKVAIQEATKEEVQAYLKDHPTTTPATAQKIISDAKTRASVLAKQPQELGTLEKMRRAVGSGLEKVQNVFDKLQPLDKLEKEANIVRGTKTTIDQSAKNTLEELRAGGQADVRAQETISNLDKMLKTDKDLQRNADAYMQAKKRIDFGKGSKLDEQIVAEVRPEVREYAEEVYKYNQKSLDLLKESGRIDEEFYQQLKQNADYVPSQAENLENLIEGEAVIGKIDNVVKKFGGEAPFYNETTMASLSQGRRIENFKLMQDAKKQYLRDALDLGRAEKVKTIEPKKGQGISYNKNKEIVVWRDGKAEVYEVPEEIAKIFNPTTRAEETLAGSLARKGQQFFKSLTTGLTVSFPLRNIIRDITGAKASKYADYLTPDAIGEAEKIILTPNALERADVKEVFRGIGFKGTQAKSQIQDRDVKDILDKFRNLDNSLEKTYPEKSAGNKLMQNISLAFQKTGKSLSKLAGKGWQKYLEGASYLGDKSEMITRYATWKSVLEGNAENEVELAMWLKNPETIPPAIRAEARRESREVSLNFTREMAKSIEDANRYFIPYFKPAILGSKRMYEVLTNPEIAPQAWRIIGNLGALEAQFKMGKMSEEEKEKYQQLDREMKTQYFEYVKDGKLRTVPLNQELAPLIKLASIGTQKLLSKNDKEQFWKEALEDLWQLGWNASVIGQTFSRGNATPQVVKPIAEIAVNKDFFTKADIETKAMQTRPKEERFTQATPEIAKKLNKVIPFLSPAQIDHLLKGYLSTAGKEQVFIFEELGDALKPAMKGEVSVSTKNLDKNNPFVRAFMPNLDTSRNQWSIDANEIIDRVKQSHYTWKDSYKRSKLTPEKQQEYRIDNKIYEKTKSYDNALSSLRQKRNDIVEKAMKKQDRLNKDIKDGNKTLKQAQLIAKTEEISIRKRLEEINTREKRLFRKIIEAEKRYKNTPK